MKKVDMLDLRLFDEEGDGGTQTSNLTDGGSGNGEEPGDASQNQPPEAPETIVYGKQSDGDQSAEENKTGDDGKGEEGNKQEYDLETLLGDENFKKQYDERVQGIIKDRFKNTSKKVETADKFQPTMDLLMERYGIGNMDELISKLENESFEEMAYAENVDVDTYKNTQKLQRENKALKGRLDSEKAQKNIDNRVQGWFAEAKEIQKEFPDFDLKEASKDPGFSKLLNAGISVDAAFKATNFEKILNNRVTSAAKKATENTINNVKNRNSKIKENGSKNTPGTIYKTNAKSLSKKDRAEIARRVSNGETIKF